MAYPSALAIILLNLIPLGLAWSGRWDAREVLMAYWWLGLLLSISTLIKLSIIRANATERVQTEFDVMDLPVWAYVPLVAIGAVGTLWVFQVVASDSANFFTGTAWRISGWEIVKGLGDPLVGWFIVLLTLRFGYSLYRNFFQHREFQRSRMLLERTVLRIFSLEVVAGIVVAGSLTTSFLPLWVAVGLIGITDVLFHVAERAVGYKPTHPHETDYGRV